MPIETVLITETSWASPLGSGKLVSVERRLDPIFDMPVDIPESDWRRFREVHATLLERYCGRVLEEVAALSRDSQGSAHDLYLKLYQLIDTRNEELACAFDDFRRSTAIFQLSILRRMKLLTDEELSVFSEQNRMQVERIVSL